MKLSVKKFETSIYSLYRYYIVLQYSDLYNNQRITDRICNIAVALNISENKCISLCRKFKGQALMRTKLGFMTLEDANKCLERMDSILVMNELMGIVISRFKLI